MLFATFFGALLFTHALGTPLQRRSLQLHEARDAPPPGFTLVGHAPSDTILKLRIALVQSDTTGLVDALYDVSTPSSPKYGQYLSKSEAEKFAAPNSETVAAVNSWLSENRLNATLLSPAGDWLGFEVSVERANDILGADYSVFTHQSTGKRTIRTLSYSISPELKGHVHLVHPTVSFPNPVIKSSHSLVVPKRSTPLSRSENSSSPCGDAITPPVSPACLQYIYDIPTTPAIHPSNQLAVTGYVEQYANQADLQLFLQQYRPDMNSSTTFSVVTLDGGSNSQNGSLAGTEANLDIQYTVGLATNVPATFISVGEDEGSLNSFLDTITYLLAQESPPQVLSTSYGWNEDMISQTFAINLCHAYAQLGTRGVSILFSSGDGGVSGTGYGECTTFVPSFPSGCPYVTSVGGTAELPTEVGAPFSGGGFSNYWSTPSYQASAVASYLSILGNNESGLYNASGRGFPDVSAYSSGFLITLDGEDDPRPVCGTSCSTPTWASIIALLNDALVGEGRPVLGFLNPWLYSTGVYALTDVVSGNNRACTNDTGFDATSGWDPVTGLGTPNFNSLMSVLGLR
ncbi:Tripeptidyl-peptidase SED2 [Sparassis crispa]|uniref:tripeptidyl-peptidase II n=1 Tax=Sparassis crispa TaxID=139825 RepID=A0A401GNY9_9APHY|nr:Tripeptidyl-peptidase SED2 [Sparassis crispa]GBE83937.1 Tripeptidyl-peptidase SED2 [Sparassis crispa]